MPNFRLLIQLATANVQVTLTLILLHPMQNDFRMNGIIWQAVKYKVHNNLLCAKHRLFCENNSPLCRK